ncbi:MAG: glycosyltransferase [Atribacterota bacterium]|nr:glycosyltransferase [Atribacterota bacterium]
MKILFCTHDDVDYGLDTLYDGLCRVSGYENIFEYPTRATLHGSIREKYSHFPIYFDYPTIADDCQKIAMLEEDEFDLILINSRIKIDAFFELLVEKSKKIPTFILDMSDFPPIEEDLINRLNALAYFKREYYKDKSYSNKIYPLSFSYSPQYIPDMDIEKNYHLFWAGRGYSKRYRYLKLAEEITKNLPKVMVVSKKMRTIYNQKEYSQKLLQSRIALNFKGYGWDNLRYYEIPLHKTLLFSKRHPLVIENDFTDGHNAIFFSSLEEMQEKLLFLLSNPDYVDRVRIRGYGHCIKYHTTTRRAEQMLRKIRKVVDA